MATSSWKLEIMRRLSKRNEEEMTNFKDIILSHCKLLEQVELLKRNIRTLEYKKDELDQELLNYQKEGVVSGGGSGGSKLNKKVEDLSAKLVEKSEQLSEAHQGKAEAMQQVADLSNKLHRKDEELSKKDAHISHLNSNLSSLERKLNDSEDAMKSATANNRKLMDEQNELQIEFNTQDKRLQEALRNYDRMKQEVMKMKNKEADRINVLTEKEKAEREEKIKKQIEDAAKPKSSLVSSVERRMSGSSRKKNSLSSDSKDPHGIYPAVLPERVFHQMEAHDGEVSALCFSNNGNLLATGGADKVVKVWSVRQPQESIEHSFTLTGSSASIMSVQFDYSDRLVLAASNDFAARIWTVEDQRQRHSLTGHTAKVFTAKFMDDSQKVITGSQDKTLKIWDLKIKKCVKTLFAGSSCCDLVPAHILGNMIISGHWDRKIRFWDMRVGSGNELAIQGRVTSLSLYPERFMLLCSTRDDTSLRLIDLRQNSITSTFTGFNLSTDWSRACFSPDGQYVAVGASDGTIHTWETLTGRPSKTKKDSSIHKGDIIGCAWHPKGQVFASVDRNKKMVLWKR